MVCGCEKQAKPTQAAAPEEGVAEEAQPPGEKQAKPTQAAALCAPSAIWWMAEKARNPRW